MTKKYFVEPSGTMMLHRIKAVNEQQDIYYVEHVDGRVEEINLASLDDTIRLLTSVVRDSLKE